MSVKDHICGDRCFYDGLTLVHVASHLEHGRAGEYTHHAGHDLGAELEAHWRDGYAKGYKDGEKFARQSR